MTAVESMPALVELQEEFVPQTPFEEVLSGIWTEVLRVERVGVRENFFELGGNSLLAARILARIRNLLAVELPLAAFFETPSIREIGTRIAAARHDAAWPVPAKLERVPRSGAWPLSYAQERLWLLEKIERTRGAYNLCLSLQLRGPLRIDALEAALTEITRRHEILRMRIVATGAHPSQTVDQTSPFALRVVDMSNCPPADRAATARRWLEGVAQEAFDLERGPPCRAALLQFDAAEHVLAVCMHHIVADAWSMSVLKRELGILYDAYRQGLPPPLKEPPVQYADYAAWQRASMRGPGVDRQLDYWTRQLANAPSVIELPLDRPRPATQSFRGASVTFVLPPALLAKAQRLARRQGATLFMVLLAAYAALICRLTGKRDVVVGTPIAGRTHPDVESLIGCFVNTLALRIDLSGDPSFLELVKRVKAAALGAYENQDVPFEKLVERLRPHRDLRWHPIFQVMFALENVPREALRFADIDIVGVESPRRTSKFDVSLYMRETVDGLQGEMEYATDLFEHRSIERFVRYFCTLVEELVSGPDRRMSGRSLVRMVGEGQPMAWNSAHKIPESETCIHELFSREAARAPAAVAVACADAHLTYAELESRSHRLANYLRRAGVGPEVIVGVCIERSVDMVVALLGILKAGGAYLPLDPQDPAKRRASVLSNAGARIVVTRTRLSAPLRGCAERLICLDADDAEIRQCEARQPDGGAGAQNLAYVMYTSGSTGNPKGVMVQHRNVVQALAALDRRLRLEPTDVIGAMTALSFDISVLEIFLPLTTGRKLVVLPRPQDVQGSTLQARAAAAGVTVLQATPSTWRLLLASGWRPSDCKLLCGGEALPVDLAGRLAEGRAWNLYGPTETTIWSTAAEIRPDAAASIGTPIAGTRIYLLDSYLDPVPVGVVGEIYIAGAGVARGYMADPGHTAERFLPDPFGRPGARMYRTGDLARLDEQGALQFIRRDDDQTKIRGIRIELGEIEAVLRSHGAVEDAAVAIVEVSPADKRLLAYVVPAGSEPIDHAALRAYVKQSLPDYMVPSAFSAVSALPLTPNGKLDRRALRSFSGDWITSAPAAHERPGSRLEEVVAKAWADVLRVDAVSVQNNFFDMGGHSLLIVQLHQRLRADLARDFPLVALFQFPSIRGFCRYLTGDVAGPSPVQVGGQRALARRQVKHRRAASVGDAPSRTRSNRLEVDHD